MLDKGFFGNHSICDNRPVYEITGCVTIRSDGNVRYHVDFIDDSVKLKFRRVDAVTALINDLMLVRDEMLQKQKGE